MEQPSESRGEHDLSRDLIVLQDLWARRDVKKVREHVRDLLPALEDPRTALLDLLEVSSTWRGKGNSLASIITTEFHQWLNDHPAPLQSGTRLKKLQARMFNLVSEGQLLDQLCSIYQIQEADRAFLLGHVTHLQRMGKYKEAAILSIRLNLQPDLDMEEMCTPLLLLERFNLVELYVAEYPELQSRLVQMLDSWSDSTFNPRKVSRQYKGLPSVKPDKLNLKTLSKLAFRLLEKHKLDPALCTNLINQRHLGTLKYLMYKRFVEKSMTYENWTDHVQNTVRENRWLQGQAIDLIVRYCGVETASRWALKSGIPVEVLPADVADALNDLCIQEKLPDTDKSRDDLQSRKERYYQLPIPRDAVYFVQSSADLTLCRDLVLQDGQVVGVDMEWRPLFGGLGRPNVSLVQVAVKEAVFLLDLLPENLTDTEEMKDKKGQLAGFIRDLFLSPTVTKLGYDMLGDLQSLDSTDNAFQGLEKERRQVVDLFAIHKQLLRTHRRSREPSGPVDVFDGSSGDSISKQAEKGLSLLVKDVLGKPLDKTEQISNWDKRPLREDQILYAAADAYCLLGVYEALSLHPEQFGLNANFKESFKGPSVSQKSPENPHYRESASVKKQILERPPEETYSPSSERPLSPREFSVICDNMLQGLGRYLRCLGVDVLMLDNDDDHRRAAEIARQDGRVILTCGFPYQTLRSQVGEGRCFRVNCSEKAQEQAIKVLKHFNIRVTLKDVFSRCQVCNCNKYLHISQERMKELMKLHGYLKDANEAKGPADSDRFCLPRGSPDNRNAEWIKELGLSADSLALPSGASLQLESLPAGLLDKVELFFCCSRCGKVFWEGSHFGRVVSQFREVLQDTGEYFYRSSGEELSRGFSTRPMKPFL
ncbi:exonuclease mut-7 homolog [Spea bombifrons]|uniref:exonuclease mut-7 homolog n=1 Tax=Spea bombifrons TaxID=233779 RepID=UPI00234A554D|nr:exonuclease mut-7 homolog [Spea bombifrons]